jgi:hypothetical protein
MGFKPPLSRGIIKKFFLISSWVLLRRSQSKIQNPKSKIEMTHMPHFEKPSRHGLKSRKPGKVPNISV